MAVFEKIILAIVIAFCGVLVVQSIGIKPPARTFPLFVSGLTGILAAFALGRSVVQPLTDSGIPQNRMKTIVLAAAGLIAYGLMMSVNYLAATVVFLFFGYVFLMPESTLKGVITAACVTLATTGFTWLCFSYWLGVNLR
uniref:tripartite tricarboxylate transporter TctB family protein n=1 Tax=Pararhizobium sp. IMCC3301 TaxID=3067904 RepID=UPI0027407AFB|nr:tripartite tricarboxylate transporter TctB family protein [Pararhizobium sp. IMCC3301]